MQMLDWGTLVKRLSNQQPIDKGGWNAFCNSATGVQTLNPAAHVALRANGKGAFYGWPDMPKLEQLRNAWFDAPDLAAQKDICRQMQIEAFVTVPYLPAGLFYQPTAYRNNLTGLLTGMPLFYNLRRA
jgi:peptide/nickel transport system substrate-binding protein